MKSLPEQIMQAELDLLDQTERLKSDRGRLRGIEIDKTIEVADAKHDNGKPIFTNEQSRTAAVERLCSEDDTWRELLAEIKQLEHDSKVTESFIEKLKREFREHLLDREEHVRRMDAFSLREELRNLVIQDADDLKFKVRTLSAEYDALVGASPPKKPEKPRKIPDSEAPF
jgi:hypothetical protein